MDLTLNNKNYTDIVNTYSEYVDIEKLFTWLVYITTPQSKKRKVVFGIEPLIKDHIVEHNNHYKIIGLSDIQLTDKSIFTHLLSNTSLPKIYILINYIEKEYAINFFNVVDSIINEKTSGGFQICYLSLRYGLETPSILQNNAQTFKSIVDKVLDGNLLHNVSTDTNKLRISVLNCLSKMIDNVEIFENDWIIKKLNKILSQDFPRGKGFYYQEKALSKKMILLNFDNVVPCANLKAVINGNRAILKEEPIAFFWSIDLNKFSFQHNIPEANQNVKNNLMKLLEYLDGKFKKDENILYFSSNTSKGICKVAMMHNNHQISIGLEKLLNFVCEESRENIIYDEKDMHKVILRCNLENEMKIGGNKSKMKI